MCELHSVSVCYIFFMSSCMIFALLSGEGMTRLLKEVVECEFCVFRLEISRCVKSVMLGCLCSVFLCVYLYGHAHAWVNVH